MRIVLTSIFFFTDGTSIARSSKVSFTAPPIPIVWNYSYTYLVKNQPRIALIILLGLVIKNNNFVWIWIIMAYSWHFCLLKMLWFTHFLAKPVNYLVHYSVQPNRIYWIPKLQLGIIQFSRIEKYWTESFGHFLDFFPNFIFLKQ